MVLSSSISFTGVHRGCRQWKIQRGGGGGLDVLTPFLNSVQEFTEADWGQLYINVSYYYCMEDFEILCWDLRNLGKVLFCMKRTVTTHQRMYFDLSRWVLGVCKTCGFFTRNEVRFHWKRVSKISNLSQNFRTSTSPPSWKGMPWYQVLAAQHRSWFTAFSQFTYILLRPIKCEACSECTDQFNRVK